MKNSALDAKYGLTRAKRVTRDSIDFDDSKLLTVFVGLYNAEMYLESVLSQLKSQDLTNCSLIVVDNCSNDGTWASIQSWVSELPVRLVRNPTNFGATGSIYLNMDYVSTPWTTFFHQDDFYYPNHLKTLADSVATQPPDVVTVSTDMASMDNAGNRVPAPPRAAWLIPDGSKESNFLANLRLQTVPWPTTAFRSTILAEVESPWHSSSFQDTEMMLKMSMLGESIYLNVETMLYRENPNSGSHELDVVERNLGAGLALLRLFASGEFATFIQAVSAGDRADFALSVLTGIRARLTESDICKYVQLQAAEVMQFTWGYKVNSLNRVVAHAYERMGSIRTVQFLSNFDDGGSTTAEQALTAEEHWFEPNFPAQVGTSQGHIGFGLVGGIWLMSRLPYAIKKFLFRLIAPRIAAQNTAHPWNFAWRSRGKR